MIFFSYAYIFFSEKQFIEDHRFDEIVRTKLFYQIFNLIRLNLVVLFNNLIIIISNNNI